MKITKWNEVEKKATDIKSGRVKIWKGIIKSEDDVNIKELPPFADFPDSNRYSYKFLGYITGKKKETIQKFSVRKRRKKKDAHLTLKWNTTIKTSDILDISDNDNYKLVTVRLGLPKHTIRNLRTEFNNFLNPITHTPLKYVSDTTEILKTMETEKYAFGIIKMLLENDEISNEEVMERYKLAKSNAIKHLNKLEELNIIETDKTRHNKKVYMLKIDKDELKNIIKEYFNL